MDKEHFYKERGITYNKMNPESVIRYQRLMKWMPLQEDTRVIEIGCMFGILRDMLEESAGKKVQYNGLEIDQNTINKITDRREDFICHNANQGLPFSDLTADYIVGLEIVEHLENPTFFFAEAKRVLKPGGKAIISMPNPYFYGEIFAQLKRSPDTEGHLSSFSYVNIDALMRFAGLKLLAVQGTYTRIPFSQRLFGKYKLFKTDHIFLTRSYMYLITKE